jgi:competence protein ComEC
MSILRATLIDVGWGDSILLETDTGQNPPCYALIDSNDTSTLRSSHIFLKRFFERKGLRIPAVQPVFDWILMTHAHTDHGQGLKRIMQDYRTRNFWYPKSDSSSVFFTDLLRYARRSSKVEHHQSVDNSKTLRPFGSIPMQILWPPYGEISSNENNNSVVISLTLGNVTMIMTGDAEVDVWTQIKDRLPAGRIIFKVPHHGSEDTLFDSSGRTTWLGNLVTGSQLGVSSHIRPHEHPDVSVITELDRSGLKYYRTDENYHITFETDGSYIKAKYSHF